MLMVRTCTSTSAIVLITLMSLLLTSFTMTDTSAQLPPFDDDTKFYVILEAAVTNPLMVNGQMIDITYAKIEEKAHLGAFFTVQAALSATNQDGDGLNAGHSSNYASADDRDNAELGQ
jgi:hypothetical protein